LQIALTCAQIGKRVVYFALEDSPGRLQKRLKTLGIENPKGLPNLVFFYFELPQIGKGAIKEIRRCIQEHKPELIIIDPWAKIKPQVKGKDLFIEEYRALEVLKGLVKDGVSILLIHHARKTQSEDPLDEIIGSTGQTAVVDNILVFKRGRGDRTGVLYLILRDFESVDLGLRFENGWKLGGSAKELMLAEEQRKIVEAIRTLENIGEKATIKGIAELVGKTQGAVKVALFDLVQKGVVLRKERGVYSLLNTNTNTKTTNLTNLTNLTNFPNFPNFSNQPAPTPLVSPEDPKVSLVSSEVKNELTSLSQDLQGLQEKVSLVSKVSNVIQSDLSSSTSDPDPSEEKVFLLMDENEKCPNCGETLWETDKALYKKGMGGARCLKCGHISWKKFFKADGSPKGREITKEDVDFLLYEPEDSK
jgi:hypothetical protein